MRYFKQLNTSVVFIGIRQEHMARNLVLKSWLHPWVSFLGHFVNQHKFCYLNSPNSHAPINLLLSFFISYNLCNLTENIYLQTILNFFSAINTIHHCISKKVYRRAQLHKKFSWMTRSITPRNQS
jgi:hypothetical protein